MEYIIRTRSVTKTFQEKEAVSDVSMAVKKGEIYGFLGPNGAGKTTLMKMLAGLVKPSKGSIEIFGEYMTHSSYGILKRMGSIIEYPIFYDKLTAWENLELHCAYMGFTDKGAIERVLDMVNLSGTGQKPVKEFSLGMKQRLGIARAIMTNPEFLILDEPINGLDPVGICEMRDLFKKLSSEYGFTLLISSHILAEIEQIADTIGVISNGRLIKEVSMEQIRRQNSEYVELVVDDCSKVTRILNEQLGLSNMEATSGSRVKVYENGVPQGLISKTLILNGVAIEEIYKKNSSLEDYFLTLINGGEASA
jgi:ABC-2 type transport system ATP-binding protein